MNYDIIATLNILSALVAGLPADKRAAARAVAFVAAKVEFGISDADFGKLVALDMQRLADTDGVDIEDLGEAIERRLTAFEAYESVVDASNAWGYINALWTQGVGRNGQPRTPLGKGQFSGSAAPAPADAIAFLGL